MALQQEKEVTQALSRRVESAHTETQLAQEALQRAEADSEARQQMLVCEQHLKESTLGELITRERELEQLREDLIGSSKFVDHLIHHILRSAGPFGLHETSEEHTSAGATNDTMLSKLHFLEGVVVQSVTGLQRREAAAQVQLDRLHLSEATVQAELERTRAALRTAQSQTAQMEQVLSAWKERIIAMDDTNRRRTDDLAAELQRANERTEAAQREVRLTPPHPLSVLFLPSRLRAPPFTCTRALSSSLWLARVACNKALALTVHSLVPRPGGAVKRHPLLVVGLQAMCVSNLSERA